ncbi:MAG TPA: Na+/H+ antiporter subunit E [Pseudonocardia sp.]|nr:Na+/H+ antiporter subunit E [Pseudonocardia sp.]
MADRTVRRSGRFLGWAAAVLLLTVIWVMLWGSLSPLVVLGGLALGVLLVATVPQPAMPLGAGARPGRLLAALGWVAVDIARSTVTVAWAALWTGRDTRSELIVVRAPGASAEILVVASSMITISPGTMVVEIDSDRGELLVHTLPVTDLEQSRAELQRTTTRLVQALQGGGPR